jgi:hypothetical protein
LLHPCTASGEEISGEERRQLQQQHAKQHPAAAAAGADVELGLEPGLPTAPAPAPVPEDWAQRAEAALEELMAQQCAAAFLHPASQEEEEARPPG